MNRGFEDGVSVVPCAEFELPLIVTGPAASGSTRDFARDVAIHFALAARGIPQAREMRGWMRGDRLVLAVRLIVAPGSRGPTEAELRGAAQLLAAALTQRTLPFSHIGYAEPGEWAQGQPLPE
jgi:hypothetical protein